MGLEESIAYAREPAEAIKEGVGGQAPPDLITLPDPKERARLIASEEQIRAAWAEGRAMDLEESIAYARELA